MRQLILVSLFLFCSCGFADSNEFILGMRQSTSERISTGARTSTRPGFGLGLKTQSNVRYNTSIKLGLMYEQRSVSDIFFGVEHNPEYQTLDLITHVSYQVSDFFSVFAGPQFSFLLTKQCRPVSGNCLIPDDPKRYFIPVQLGVDYVFLQNYGAELFYEIITQEYWENTFKNSQTYGLNLKYRF